MQKSEIVKQNFVLEKLSKAGIEVVTDKAVFNRILESENILQKMSEDLQEIENLSKQFNEESNKTKNLEKTVKQNEFYNQHLKVQFYKNTHPSIMEKCLW